MGFCLAERGGRLFSHSVGEEKAIETKCVCVCLCVWAHAPPSQPSVARNGRRDGDEIASPSSTDEFLAMISFFFFFIFFFICLRAGGGLVVLAVVVLCALFCSRESVLGLFGLLLLPAYPMTISPGVGGGGGGGGPKPLVAGG